MNLQLAHNCHAISQEIEVAVEHYAYAITERYAKTEIEVAAIAKTEQLLNTLRVIGPVATWKLIEIAINDYDCK